jgi:hypothetical protein
MTNRVGAALRAVAAPASGAACQRPGAARPCPAPAAGGRAWTTRPRQGPRLLAFLCGSA